MNQSSTLRATTNDLLEQAATLMNRARMLQAGAALSDDVHLAEDYYRWFAECLALLDDDLREFEGGLFSQKIRSFLEAPRAPNVLYELTEPDKRLPGMGPWQHPVESSFVGPIRAQQLILREHEARRAGSVLPNDLVVSALRRFPRFIRPLADRRSGKPGLQIANEYDVQDAVEAILSSLFDDVRPEERTPSHGAGSSSIDFVIPAARLAVEVKMTRPTLPPRTLVDELAVDIERYRRHPDVTALIAFVYDPSGSIRNRAGLEGDLQRIDGPLEVHVVVVG